MSDPLTRADVDRIVEEARAKGLRPDLRGADLSRADLSRADLSRATGLFATAKLGRHDAIAAGGYIAIGCERHTYDEWLERGAEIGRANGYTDAEIARYMAWISLVVPWLRDEEAKLEAK